MAGSINPGRTISGATMAKNWAAGLARSGDKWVSGVENPRSKFNANPAAAASNWVAGVTSPTATTKFERGLAGVSDADYVKSVEGPGKSNFVNGAKKDTKFSKKADAIASAIQSILPTLPKKGPKGTNGQRSLAFSDAMHQKAGTF